MAVITPYVDQVREIRELLRRDAQMRNVDCSTVHRFQGHERDVVILDTVDAAPLLPSRLVVGGARDQTTHHLLNVSISRARGKLIIVADLAYFRRNAPGSTITIAPGSRPNLGKDTPCVFWIFCALGHCQPWSLSWLRSSAAGSLNISLTASA